MTFHQRWTGRGGKVDALLAPELSAQFMTAPTGRARVIRNLVPAAAAIVC